MAGGDPARTALFDLAVARALTYLRRARVAEFGDATAVRAALEVWYLKTRFAYRVPLEDVVQALGSYPPEEGTSGASARWIGGREGGWRR